ncbi:MAG TPA: YigZ family protein [Bacteroidales bacterium]|nr:YigZ family protein [Bacteroidales bacterium]
MEDDKYKTISSFSQGLYKEKGSRFIAMAYPVREQSEIKPILDRLRKEHHEAKHHCYAWMLGADRTNYRVNDDGEPSGTGGKPILGQINSAGLTNILIVVIRYFGGTLLGVSGLINAYRSAAADAIKNNRITDQTLQEYYEIIFPYTSMNDVMKILKEENMGQSDQHFDIECKMKINFRASSRDKIIERFTRIEGLIYTYLETQ